MASRPKATLDDLAVPKGDADPPLPSPSALTAAPVPTLKNYAHTLSLRLTAEQYRQLRRYVARREEEGAGRVTHQSIIETALAEFLERQAR